MACGRTLYLKEVTAHGRVQITLILELHWNPKRLSKFFHDGEPQ